MRSNGKTVVLLGMIAGFLMYKSYFNDAYFVPNDRTEKAINLLFQTKKPDELKNDKDYGHPSPIIILTYMRSGSSFLGDVLQQSNNVFYLFEPLRLPQFEIRKNKPFQDLYGQTRHYTNFLDAGKDLIRNWTTCELFDLPKIIWNDGFFSKSKKAKLFKACQVFQANVMSQNETLYNCVTMLKDICLGSKHLLMKTIRLPLDQMDDLMVEFPTMKVIHLIRDPRGTVSSQLKFGRVKVKTFSKDVADFCSRVFRDLVTFDLLESKYPGRIKRIIYEDLADDPIDVAKTLYDFIGMDFTPLAEQHIFNITSTGKDKKKCGNLCIIKANSTKEANNWRSKINFKKALEIDQICRLVYNRLGFKNIVNEKMLRNINIQLRTKDASNADDYRFA